MHMSHSHLDDCCCETRLLNPASIVVVAANPVVPKLKVAVGVDATAGFDPGFGVSHATHLVLS